MPGSLATSAGLHNRLQLSFAISELTPRARPLPHRRGHGQRNIHTASQALIHSMAHRLAADPKFLRPDSHVLTFPSCVISRPRLFGWSRDLHQKQLSGVKLPDLSRRARKCFGLGRGPISSAIFSTDDSQRRQTFMPRFPYA